MRPKILSLETNLVKKNNISSLNWNLVLTLIWVRGIKWWRYFGQKYPFLENFFQKISIFCWSLNFELILIWIWRIGWWFFFPFLDRKRLFLVKLVQKLKTICWSWNFRSLNYFEYIQFDGNVLFFVFYIFSIYHFDVNWLISYQFTLGNQRILLF